MPDWNSLSNEIRASGSTYDLLRRKYLRSLHDLTGRNTIIYYSGWLQKPDPRLIPVLSINDIDKNAFMTSIHELDRSKGLDLILHTPGGDGAAAESLVDYLRQMFDIDVRGIVPQLAMSAGTMIALSCKSIIMGKQSSLGPIDPQLNGLPAHGVIEEFKQAFEEIKADPSKIPIWQVRIARFPPAFIGECQRAIDWSNEMVKEWLSTGMFNEESKSDEENIRNRVSSIVTELGSHALTKSHARHIPSLRCKEIGLKIEMMEEDQKLQEAILTLHHITMHTLADTPTIKIVENHNGKAFVQTIT
jgi:membrane-bound ClpP family serine protease